MERTGEGVLDEERVFRYVQETFPETRVIRHGGPPWLGRQHLDIWIPSWRVAVEFHGEQHFRPVDYFGGEDGHEQRRNLDDRKINLCKENDVHLLIVTKGGELDELRMKIEEARDQVRDSRSGPLG